MIISDDIKKFKVTKDLLVTSQLYDDLPDIVFFNPSK